MADTRLVPILIPTGQTPQQEEEQRYLPVLHGKATDALATMSSRGIKKNPLSNEYSITSREVKLVLRDFEKLQGTLGINQHKLLSVGIASFAKQNTVGSIPSQGMNYRVAFSLRDFGLACGYDLTERDTDSPEAAEKERKRLKNVSDDLRKKVKEDLKVLGAEQLTFSETVKGKPGDWAVLNVLASWGIVKGYVNMTFNPDMGDYLIRLPLTQYPKALLAVDARNPNAYNIGLKMAEHHSMDSNQRNGRADRLAVHTLLEYTQLPSIEDTRASRKDWVERIKEPFERALDTLTETGVLSDWRYTKAKAEPIPDDQAGELFDSYEAWAGAYVQFELRDAPDQTARLEAQKEKATKRKRSSSRKKKETTP